MAKIPKPVEDWYRFEMAAGGQSDKAASLHIYDAIGGWFGIRVSELVQELADLDVEEIDVYLNSPGGDAFGGLAIMNALRRHKATVTVHVDGLAASAASVIAMGGDVVEMGRGSQLMIHDASAIAWGPAAQMAKTAAVLDKTSNSYAAVYAARAGGTTAGWREAMREESWYTADEAVKAGLADRTIDAEAEPEGVEAAWDLSIYAYAGRASAPAPIIPKTSATPVAAASPAPGDEHSREEYSMAFMDDLRQRLGADADADEAAVLAALDAQLARPNVPEGTTLIESAQLDALQADAAAGRQARDAQLKAEREATIEVAVRDGRIAPSRREHWAAQLEADAGLAEVIAGLPKIINTDEIGFTGGIDEASDEDAIYAKAWGTTEQKGN